MAARDVSVSWKSNGHLHIHAAASTRFLAGGIRNLSNPAAAALLQRDDDDDDDATDRTEMRPHGPTPRRYRYS